MKDQNTADDRMSGYATMGRGELRFEARAVTGDVVIGGLDEQYYQLITIYLSPEKARELAKQIKASADAADHDNEVKQRVSAEIKAEVAAHPEGGGE